MPKTKKKSSNVLFVLGAGVDVPLGLPVVNNLFRELHAFASGEGKAVDKAIRGHVNVRFNLAAHAGEEGENLGEKLLGSHVHLLPVIQLALRKHPSPEDENVKTLSVLMGQMRRIADANILKADTVSQPQKIAGDGSATTSDTLLDTAHIELQPLARQAMRKIFTGVMAGMPALTDEERAAFEVVVAALSNFEEMLADLFTGYFTKNTSNQKRYFYLAWLLWALPVDWNPDPPQTYLPAIVPPLLLKPVICTEYLERWYACGQRIRKADVIVVVGYSFNVADEHFNDLIRKYSPEAKLLVINPSIDPVAAQVCQLLGLQRQSLEKSEIEGFEALRGGRLTLMRARAEEVGTRSL